VVAGHEVAPVPGRGRSLAPAAPAAPAAPLTRQCAEAAAKRPHPRPM